MKILVRCLVVVVMLIAVSGTVYLSGQTKPAAPVKPAPPAAAAASDPADTDDEVLHVFMCEMSDGTTEAEVDAAAQIKFKALKQMPGAENARMNILWPVAVSNMGEVDFWVVWTFPSTSDWGKFWDAYEDSSPLARADDATEGKIECPNSMMWETHEISAPK